ncbi:MULTISPECIES: hypothetical protein [Streptomyces]|uniref:BioF2-like acetyltransferase domain-containing protein n=1 Tax=Streptomyces sviceus (strain ATCC 29083 / DSM 924 / JCM 4929 / NBRC 13980 / NCIMB 11184 / NRRL 5439 / UC 5370) TaxID=463191 RepID=B5HT97_STRX2|nr:MULTISPECIES: hypothetical protein [Streptomyces]EDY56052.2 conserved hypothetical protein [Streptomyces sviceus ATCC 29083]MYT09023.1 hypothetical protein [Streptomyces sp. SID5470]
MTTTLLDSIGALSPEQFDALDDSAGAAGCHHRLLQRESDLRWRMRYAVRREADRLLAAVPACTRLGTGWPDPAYDVRRWGLPAGLVPEDLTADRCLFVGGCTDLRSALHIGPTADGERVARSVLAGLARTAAETDQCLAFPYVYAPARRLIAQACRDRAGWAPLGREARFPDADAPDREERAVSRVRGVLRRDRRLIAAAGVRTTVSDWADVADDAADLIARHNSRKGSPDHPEFVALRHEQWALCEPVRVIALTASAGTARGVLTALVWRSELELYEIGLTGQESPDRIAVYLDLLFHQPLAYARDHRLTAIRAGLAAEVPKKSRGAVMHEVYGGVLSVSDTKRLADEIC